MYKESNCYVFRESHKNPNRYFCIQCLAYFLNGLLGNKALFDTLNSNSKRADSIMIYRPIVSGQNRVAAASFSIYLIHPTIVRLPSLSSTLLGALFYQKILAVSESLTLKMKKKKTT